MASYACHVFFYAGMSGLCIVCLRGGFSHVSFKTSKGKVRKIYSRRSVHSMSSVRQNTSCLVAKPKNAGGSVRRLLRGCEPKIRGRVPRIDRRHHFFLWCRASLTSISVDRVFRYYLQVKVFKKAQWFVKWLFN